MKTLLAAVAAFFVMAGSAYAVESDGWQPFEKSTEARVPTGYQVKGCKDYYIDKKGRVHSVCKKVVGERWWWFDALPHSGGGE